MSEVTATQMAQSNNTRRTSVGLLCRSIDPCQHALAKPLGVVLSLLSKLDQFIGHDFFSRLVAFFDLKGGARDLKREAEKPNGLRIERVAV